MGMGVLCLEGQGFSSEERGEGNCPPSSIEEWGEEGTVVPLGAVGEVTGVPAGPCVWQDGVHASSLHGLRQQFPESLFNPCEDLRGAYSFLFINQKAASETGSLIQDLRARLSDQGPLLSPHQAELTWVPSPGLKSREPGDPSHLPPVGFRQPQGAVGSR